RRRTRRVSSTSDATTVSARQGVGSQGLRSGPAYRFGVLGPLLVERDGARVGCASGQQRALLAVLLAGRQPGSRDRLIDELWGERPPPTAVKALSVILSRLRAQIGDAVVYRAGAYELSVGEYELDADRLSALV